MITPMSRLCKPSAGGVCAAAWTPALGGLGPRGTGSTWGRLEGPGPLEGTVGDEGPEAGEETVRGAEPGRRE